MERRYAKVPHKAVFQTDYWPRNDGDSRRQQRVDLGWRTELPACLKRSILKLTAKPECTVSLLLIGRFPLFYAVLRQLIRGSGTCPNRASVRGF